MRTSDLRPLVRECRARAAVQLGADGAAAIDAVLGVIDRFADTPMADLADRLATLRPLRKRASVAKGAVVDSAVVERYVGEACKRVGDHSGMIELIARISTDKAVKKPEAVAIAKGVGVKINSKTTKQQAIEQIEGLSSARERDRQLAERIRQGA